MAEVVLALDLPDATEALRLLDRLPEVSWVKVGSILMTREGAPFVRALVGRGLRVFLDLKWHDIPHTVAGAVTAARELGVSMATVHTLGGRNMMEAAAAAAGDRAVEEVRVPTALDAATSGPSTRRSVRSILPADGLVVVPGIRQAGDAAGDQVRVATAGEAARAGATHLVVGRPVLHAPDPASALRLLVEEARCAGS